MKHVDIRPTTGAVRFQIDNAEARELTLNLNIHWLESGGIRVNGRRLDASTVRVHPAIEGGHLQMAAQVHVGDLTIRRESNGLSIVNQLPLESYLVGTLAAEMNQFWDLEALKAQAVASRSFARDAIRHARHPDFDIEGSTNDQAFAGAGVVNEKIERAVRETVGVLLWEGTRPLKAFFHSRCGGTTQSAREVWQDSSAKTQSVACPYCRKNPARWKMIVQRDQLIRAFGFEPAPGALALSASRNPSGRVTKIMLLSEGLERNLSINELRSRLGFTRLRSAIFDWQLTRDFAIFEGRGFGHGVGLCQWGAQYLAKMGKDFLGILRHYYPGVRIASG
ncbi:MAG: SpoIID/LytB domain-containing protein [Deltaproteobacteria bacterium]|nr:SpoIID/LytB domain-containing protein [Deltaproteobacteria bacterium]MBI3294764.1 SpoIID/LytB domain-containing protein [Deltaproteobacteria bacterium]